jgi:dTDP-glucose 4,6-dehydratase
MAKVLVTGGCGFIGSAFVRRLLGESSGAELVANLDSLSYAGNPENLVEVEDSSRYRFVHGDIRDEALVERVCKDYHIDTIVHFAAETHVDRSIDGPLPFIETNVVGTVRLLEVVRRLPHIHFHHISTDEVFGSLGETGWFRETTPYDPRSPYSASKAASDHLVRAYAHTYGLSVTLSNCSNNYGPFQFPEKLIPLMILNMLGGKELPIYGDGRNVRDWIHVDDHVTALLRILEDAPAGSTYLVGGGAERTNLQLLDSLIRAVAAETGQSEQELSQLKRFVSDRPGHDRRYAIDWTRMREDLGWQPEHDLNQGLEETVRWYLTHQSWIETVRTGAYRAWLTRNYETRGANGS